MAEKAASSERQPEAWMSDLGLTYPDRAFDEGRTVQFPHAGAGRGAIVRENRQQRRKWRGAVPIADDRSPAWNIAWYDSGRPTEVAQSSCDVPNQLVRRNQGNFLDFSEKAG
jgi:hypothetical protein